MMSPSSPSQVLSSFPSPQCGNVGETQDGTRGGDQGKRRVCVFAGSSLGSRQAYQQVARELGEELARRGLGLVYGGACVGLMGEVADAALQAGGEVIGVVPQGVWSEEANHTGLTIRHEVGTMHERKALMAELADGFLALPGGLGTFDELCEILAWAQLGLHTKPIGLLNVAEYFQPFLQLVATAVREGFIAQNPPLLVSDGAEVGMLLDQLLLGRQPDSAALIAEHANPLLFLAERPHSAGKA